MSATEEKKVPLVGTPAHHNWRAALEDEPLLSLTEYPIYTDAWMTGEVAEAAEPYQFFNLTPQPREQQHVRAAMVLRLSLHVDFELPTMEKTEDSAYFGGWMVDEVTALASLKCGVRMRAGGLSRIFELGERQDPRGHPYSWGMESEPALDLHPYRTILPGVRGAHSMMPIEGMRSFPKLSVDQAIALVRSARLYQDALWLSESAPNLAWIMLVSAVETAANSWKSAGSSIIERLETSKPDLIAYLNTLGVSGLPERIAQEFVDSMGATRKFIDFLVAHPTPAPEKRPAVWGQVDWTEGTLSSAYRKIYGYRSRALHGGRPFPLPMCSAPERHEGWETWAERPTGSSMSGDGGTWKVEDTPMLLNTFAYIAHSSLNQWWSSMAPGRKG